MKKIEYEDIMEWIKEDENSRQLRYVVFSIMDRLVELEDSDSISTVIQRAGQVTSMIFNKMECRALLAEEKLLSNEEA